MQLSQIYGSSKKKISIKIPEVQQQDNSIDCGLFAIANMVEFCFNKLIGDSNLQFNINYMRDHLIFCLEKNHFRPFPKMDNISHQLPILVKPEIHTIYMNCKCGNPDTIEDMIGCDWKSGNKTCNIWTHKSCTGLNISQTTSDWYCEKHKS